VAVEILNRAGFRCEVAINGQQAVERLGRETFDAVLMDCQMPVMDGITAAREIRRLEGEGKLAHRGRVPIVALTANAIEGDREHCLAAGMDEYVAKPLKAAKLVEVLRSLLRDGQKTLGEPLAVC
jgi:CheY-like chemotaxis protein